MQSFYLKNSFKRSRLIFFSLFFFLPSILLASIKNYSSNPVISELVYKLRDPNTSLKEFRDFLKKTGEYLGVEVAKDLNTTEKKILTVLGKEASHIVLDEDVVLVTILRAGLPLQNGLQEIFANSEAGFFGMARNEQTLLPEGNYVGIPDIKNKTVILADTMIATAGSILKAIEEIEAKTPKKIIVVCAIAGEIGLKKILEHNKDIKIYAAAIDPIVNRQGFIVPGLGDAGDRAFGNKIN